MRARDAGTNSALVAWRTFVNKLREYNLSFLNYLAFASYTIT